MAGVAQMVERQVVVLDAVGSSPIARPTLSSIMTARGVSVQIQAALQR